MDTFWKYLRFAIIFSIIYVPTRYILEKIVEEVSVRITAKDDQES